MYHVAPIEISKSILANGIDSNLAVDEHKAFATEHQGNYLAVSPQDAWNVRWMGDYATDGDFRFHVYAVDVQGLDLLPDPLDESGGQRSVYTQAAIPPERIKRVPWNSLAKK